MHACMHVCMNTLGVITFKLLCMHVCVSDDARDFLNPFDICVVKVGHTNLSDNHCNWSHTGQPMLVPAKPQFPFLSRSCTHTHTHTYALSLSLRLTMLCFVLKDWLVKQNLYV